MQLQYVCVTDHTYKHKTIIRIIICDYISNYWKTDHNVTLGQLHFIGPANSHTHTLPVHCCINGLS